MSKENTTHTLPDYDEMKPHFGRFVELLKLSARLGKFMPAPDEYILQALDMVYKGEATCDFFLSGAPDVKRVNDIAIILQSGGAVKN